MDDQDKSPSREEFLSNLRKLVTYTSLEDARKQYYYTLLTEARFDQMTEEESAELLTVLSEAQDKMEEMVFDNGDPEQIYALAEAKKFANDLLNEAEEKVLQQVLSLGGDTNTETTTQSKNKGSWLLDKLAGLAE